MVSFAWRLAARAAIRVSFILEVVSVDALHGKQADGCTRAAEQVTCPATFSLK